MRVVWEYIWSHVILLLSFENLIMNLLIIFLWNSNYFVSVGKLCLTPYGSEKIQLSDKIALFSYYNHLSILGLSGFLCKLIFVHVFRHLITYVHTMQWCIWYKWYKWYNVAFSLDVSTFKKEDLSFYKVLSSIHHYLSVIVVVFVYVDDFLLVYFSFWLTFVFG